MGRRQQVVEDAAAELSREGIKAMAVLGDVRFPDQCQSAIDSVDSNFGTGLHILVNSAAGNFLAPAEILSSGGFKTVMDIDTLGTFNMCRGAYPLLAKAQGGGCIINISATLQYGATFFQAHACAAKAAIDSLTRTLALEWGPDRIRVNAVAPGPTAGTAGMAKLSAGRDQSQSLSKYIPLGRMGEKWEIGQACVYLASSAAGYITGAILVVDGGHWLYREPFAPKSFVMQVSRKLEKTAADVGRVRSRL
eukprot:evm.model.scf_212.1 EVM.evm.TU.scf_212.1   scf_212:478-2505(+)